MGLLAFHLLYKSLGRLEARQVVGGNGDGGVLADVACCLGSAMLDDEAAETDTLTKLYNRRYFYKYMSGIKDAKEPVSIFYLDLDNFKKINDTYGHEAGDELLCRVARILEDIFREGVCVRFGGDEFVCAIEGKATNAELKAYAEEFLLELTRLVEDYQDFAGISASIGIAYTEAVDDVDILLKKSDVAMYEAKNSGKAAYRIAK